MRSAPAVSVRCTNDTPWRCAQTALPALAAGVVAAWLALQLGAPVWLLAVCAVKAAVVSLSLIHI